MTGTILNSLAILVGGLLGLVLGSRFPKRLEETLMMVMGVVTVLLGIQFALETKNILIPLGSLLVGVLVGETLKIHDRIQTLASRVEARLMKTRGQGGVLAKGFITASLLYCIGPFALLGPIRDGLLGDSRMLLLKSALDGIASIVFASTLGIGVPLSAISVFLFQGSIALGAKGLDRVLTPVVIGEFSATGGIILVLLGLNLLNLKSARVANLLPSLVVVPVLVTILVRMGIALG